MKLVANAFFPSNNRGFKKGLRIKKIIHFFQKYQLASLITRSCLQLESQLLPFLNPFLMLDFDP